MSTTAQKLEYLGTTKSQLKDMINYGLDENKITSSTTFRNYVSSIKEAFLEALRTPDTLFTNLPKKSGAGSNITLNDTANAPMKLELKGNTSQFSTTGKNLWNILETISGTTMTTSDNIVYQLQTSTNNRTYTINGEANTAYTIDITIKGGTNGEDIYLYFVYSDSSQDNIGYFTGSSSTETKRLTKTSNSSKTLVGISLQTYNVGNKKDYTFTKPILVKGTYTASNIPDYEPYTGGIASPNPSYPQDIHTISGSNKVVVCGKNLFDLSNATKSGNIFVPNPIKEAGDYTISCVNTNNSYSFAVCFVDNIGDTTSDRIGGYFAGYDFASTRNSYTQTITNEQANAKYLLLALNSGSTTIDNIATLKVQIEKGSATTYTPYVSQEADIDLKSKNLFNPLTFTPKNAMTCTSDGIIRAYTMSSAGWSYSNANIIQTLEAGTYQFTVFFDIKDTNSYPSIRVYDSSNNELALFGNLQNIEKKTMQITLSQKTTIGVMFKISDGQCRFQIEKGNNATDYEPYYDYGEYCKIGNYEDKFIRSNDGTWQLEKNIGKVVLDGTQSIQAVPTNTTGDYRFYITVSPLAKGYNSTDTAQIYCNKLVGITRNSSYGETQGICYSADVEGNKLIVFIEDTKNMSSTDFQTWLGNNNLLVYYQLNNSTYTQITGTLANQLENVYKNMLSQEGTTNISQVNNDLAFILNVSAIEE